MNAKVPPGSHRKGSGMSTWSDQTWVRLRNSMFVLAAGILTLALLTALSACSPSQAQEAAAQPTTEAAPDPGVEACEAMIAGHEAGVKLEGAEGQAVFAGLYASSDQNLQAAAATLERYDGLPEDQQWAAMGDLMTALAQVAAGCAAVGVPLPAEMFE